MTKRSRPTEVEQGEDFCSWQIHNLLVLEEVTAVTYILCLILAEQRKPTLPKDILSQREKQGCTFSRNSYSSLKGTIIWLPGGLCPKASMIWKLTRVLKNHTPSWLCGLKYIAPKGPWLGDLQGSPKKLFPNETMTWWSVRCCPKESTTYESANLPKKSCPSGAMVASKMMPQRAHQTGLTGLTVCKPSLKTAFQWNHDFMA